MKYLLKLRKNLRIELEVYVAFDSPVQVEQEGSHLSPSLEPPCMGYKWPPVLRKHCQKGCNVSPLCPFCGLSKSHLSCSGCAQQSPGPPSSCVRGIC